MGTMAAKKSMAKNAAANRAKTSKPGKTTGKKADGKNGRLTIATKPTTEGRKQDSKRRSKPIAELVRANAKKSGHEIGRRYAKAMKRLAE